MKMDKQKRVNHKKLELFSLFMVLIIFLLSGCEEADERKKAENIISEDKYAGIYEISELLDETQYDEYINDSGHLFGRLLNFRHKMANSSEFGFYAYANNFVEIIEREIPETCIVNHGTEYEEESGYEIDGESITAAEAIQVSENFFTLFPLKISAGRSFESSDFNCRNSGLIPVILGNAYRKSFHLGDSFEGYYICERRNFIVIGFTDSESEFYLRSNNCMRSYDDFIIMPFENIGEDSYSARVILLQQICGFISPDDSIESARETIRKYLSESGLENWDEAMAVFEKDLQEKMK